MPDGTRDKKQVSRSLEAKCNVLNKVFATLLGFFIATSVSASGAIYLISPALVRSCCAFKTIPNIWLRQQQYQMHNNVLNYDNTNTYFISFNVLAYS